MCVFLAEPNDFSTHSMNAFFWLAWKLYLNDEMFYILVKPSIIGSLMFADEMQWR